MVFFHTFRPGDAAAAGVGADGAGEGVKETPAIAKAIRAEVRK
jgi:hypothetical protein